MKRLLNSIGVAAVTWVTWLAVLCWALGSSVDPRDLVDETIRERHHPPYNEDFEPAYRILWSAVDEDRKLRSLYVLPDWFPLGEKYVVKGYDGAYDFVYGFDHRVEPVWANLIWLCLAAAVLTAPCALVGRVLSRRRAGAAEPELSSSSRSLQ